MANLRKTERNGIENFNDIAMKCTWILKKQRRCKRTESRVSTEKGDQQFTKNGRGLKSQLTWSYNPEQKCRKTRSTDQKMLQ